MSIIDSVFFPSQYGNIDGNGQSMNTLGDKWWGEYAISLPASEHPLVVDDNVDIDGTIGSNAKANVAQLGDFMYIGGAFDADVPDVGPLEITRTITVPQGKILVFPLLNFIYWGSLANREGVEEVTNDINEVFASITNLDTKEFFEVPLFISSPFSDPDGDFRDGFRFQSPQGGLNFVFPENSILGGDPGFELAAVADGYWIAVDTEELNAGTYQFNFGGSVDTTPEDPNNPPEFALDINYVITVEQNFHEIIGTFGNDTRVGTSGRDLMDGLEGNDILVGRKGNDIIDGWEGNDTIKGGKNNDTTWKVRAIPQGSASRCARRKIKYLTRLEK